MPLEKGGRADKQGNRYENNCVIYELLKILNEQKYSVIIEALGDDEKGTDILVTTNDGIKEHQQCKARNASKENWEITNLKSKGILQNWKKQLDRDDFRQVALVSPISCSFLVDLHSRAVNTSGNAEDFYEMQIKSSSSEFKNFYENFCKEMGLDTTNKTDILKSINYLERINFKNVSEYSLDEYINQYIQFLFSNDKNIVYNAFVNFVVMKDILGKEITQMVILDYLRKQGITLRLRDGDERILPKLEELNKEYRANFNVLQGGLIYRKEFDDCINAIKQEKSIIISGAAGYGKSGCTEAILNYCESEKIPHLAIKLDRKIPHKNCKAWGEEIGLSSSIAYSLHCISKNENAVIVLDQLDALRWTQANSSEALSVCMELINQVNILNHERRKKIIIVFVCRTYDLENDNNISSLFKSENTASNNMWINIKIQNFDEDTVKKCVGEKYEQLSTKLKKLLQTPSNLYIWQHLDADETHNNFSTTSHLIEGWYKQICKKSISMGVLETVVRNTNERMIDLLDQRGCLFLPKRILGVDEAGIDYLISAEMMIIQNGNIGFVHQSILDYFLAKRMMEKYFNGIGIEQIIGDKSKQTPAKRYQVQMFLQNILEYNTEDFIQIGESMLESHNIRYYMKYIFYEMLGQQLEPDEVIQEFIIENCEHELYGEHIFNNVIFAKKQYIEKLRNAKILDKWFNDPQRKQKVFTLLQSISPFLSVEDVAFIQKRALKNREDDEMFMRCFPYDISKENNEMFELRMLYYDKYPDFAKSMYIDVKSMIAKVEIRTIRIIEFWLKNKIETQGEFSSENLLSLSDEKFSICNAECIFDTFLKYIPMEGEIRYSDWTVKWKGERSLERFCIKLLKKANIMIISKEPELFWDYYRPYIGKGYDLFNELFLHGLQYLPENFSNRIISYISNNLDKNIFDYTSGAENQLMLVKKVLQEHSSKCSASRFRILENKICRYISSKAVQRYKYRIEYNQEKKGAPVYWSFWGELQYELLSILPKERLSNNANELLKILERKFRGKTNCYNNCYSHGGNVVSPISGKDISKKQWMKIITNEKLKNRRNTKWNKKNGVFIESSSEMYAGNFNSVVRKEPEKMIQLVLENKDKVLPAFIDSLFSGVEFSEHSVAYKMMETMFETFPCDMQTQRASSFCGIIEKMGKIDWSEKTINQLKNIAIHHQNPSNEKLDEDGTNEEKIKSSDKLHSTALNCVRGHAARAIGNLLWENATWLEEFKDTIEKIMNDENSAVRFASLYALAPAYNIDKEWAEIKILNLYESDIRMLSFRGSKDILFLLYPRYRERVLKIVKECFYSKDTKLIEIGGYALTEFYILYNEFKEIILDIQSKSEEQVKAIFQMARLYLSIDQHRELAKDVILAYKNLDIDVEIPLSQIFFHKCIDFEKDKDFIKELMKSKISRRTVRVFVHYLEEEAVAVIDYADIIIALCENVLQMDGQRLRNQFGIEDEISKLIMSLYDETTNSKTGRKKVIAEKCLELWDIMFERQLGSVREISRKLMER